MGSTPSPGHRFKPQLRPRHYQCLWICLMATSMWVKLARLPLYSSGKGRCCTKCDLWDHHMQAKKCAGERSTLDFKPMRKETQSPKTGVISGSTKWALVQQELKKKSFKIGVIIMNFKWYHSLKYE